MFFNEVELLEIRLAALNNQVDKFIVIESSQTFSGTKKKLILSELSNLKKQYGSKLVLISRSEDFKSYKDIVLNLDKNKNFNSHESKKLIKILKSHTHYDKGNLNFVLDTFQREACLAYIARLTDLDDIIIFSDADELPDNILKIKDFYDKEENKKTVISLLQHEFWYYPNIYHDSKWEGSIVGISSEIIKCSLNYYRQKVNNKRINTANLKGFNGYHLTNMGGVDRLKTKIENWTHQEFNNNLIISNLEERIIRGEDVYGRTNGTVTKLIDLNEFYSEFYVKAIKESKLTKAKKIINSKPNFIKKIFNKILIKFIELKNNFKNNNNNNDIDDRKIYDCFIFNHEIELLEIRLNILDKYVDKFIITEGDITFTGLPKESYYLKNKEKFKKWEKKIIHNHIKIPNLKGPWEREIFSRNAMVNLDIFEDKDLIIMSDIDEIPNPLVIKEVTNWISSDRHFTLEQACYAYWINNLYSNKWYGSRIATYKYMQHRRANDIREATEAEYELTGSIITNGGWHFTYLGDEKYIREKLSSFSHTEFDVPEITDKISENLAKGKDILNRTKVKYKRVDLDNSFPEFLINNQRKYSHLIKFSSDLSECRIKKNISFDNKNFQIKKLKPNKFKKYFKRGISLIKPKAEKIKNSKPNFIKKILNKILINL